MNNTIMEVIESYNNYIEKISPGCLQIAEHLRKDEIDESMRMILQFSEGMGWLIHASELLNENNVNVILEVQAINEFLQEINNGLEVMDYVIVADMFEYEIAPFFEQVTKVEGIEN
ncbi:hypothetical protein [Ureibacillus sinduriensis]|uniref:DUF8042 domain-containing protein n=2 Tax=Ureibacillus sinduriensis TaxID=561440 RepID=A0A0A3INT2_9BACL|nr:hypothetical protein [Ureibacillus sinduriensis]KGR76497.1 hypothetical protein CD33_06400 [Ureibacillus sinduriensis BLB-1 = JCM 15800]